MWENQVQSEEEGLLIVKTRRSLVPEINRFIAGDDNKAGEHSYDCPEGTQFCVQVTMEAFSPLLSVSLNVHLPQHV